MNIIKTREGDTLRVALEGRLDAITCRQLEGALRTEVSDIKKLDFDLADLAYISSGGIRVLLAAYQAMSGQGEMVIRNVQPDVMEIFEFTGLTDVLTII